VLDQSKRLCREKFQEIVEELLNNMMIESYLDEVIEYRVMNVRIE